jgi:2-(1,2-epoxy-1,2-dihydrophenyl)acetyl-CoA isomerase
VAYEQISVERDGSVARVVMNRPDKLNALTATMSDELSDALTTIGSDDGVRCVVITGAGRGFCAGQDLTEFRDAYSSGQRPDIREHLAKTYHRLIPLLFRTPKPVVAAVNGVTAGAGLSVALACDIRVASEEARFTQAFVKIGLVPDSGGTYFLPRVVGFAKALELSMTGEMLDAHTALELGLVSKVFPADTFQDQATAFARTLAAMPTRALVATRELLAGASTTNLEEALQQEADAQAAMAETHDHLEGVTAFAEKREPRFEGR